MISSIADRSIPLLSFLQGWLAWAIPSNLLLQKSPAATYLGFNILLWGVLLMAQGESRKQNETTRAEKSTTRT